MWVAENHHARLLGAEYFFEVVEIHTIRAVGGFHKVVAHHHSAIAHRNVAEWVIHRLLNHYFVAGAGEIVDGEGYAAHYAWHIYHIVGGEVEIVAARFPVDNRLPKLGCGHRVAIHRVLKTLDECLRDGRADLKIHVGNPQRSNISGAEHLGAFAIFHCHRLAAIYYLVEIVFHNLSVGFRGGYSIVGWRYLSPMPMPKRAKS